MNIKEFMKSKILTHFIKGKVYLSPMETILMIPSELEHLDNLVKLVRRKKKFKFETTKYLWSQHPQQFEGFALTKHIEAKLCIC